MPSTELTVPEELATEVKAFGALNTRQQRFVMALLQFGAGKGKRALCARAAGYEGSDAYVNVQAHRLYHNPLVRQALAEVSNAELISYQLFSIEGIGKLAESAVDEKVRLKALIELANRTGFAVEQVINVKHEDINKTNDTILDQMVEVGLRRPDLVDKLPEPRRTLVQSKIDAILGNKPVIEATVVERDPDADLLGE